MRRSLIALGCMSILSASGCTTLPEPTDVSDSAHNPQNALDWAGTYSGVLPCADCPGIETVVTLNADGTYSATTHYLDKGGQRFDEQGTFRWDRGGNTIILSGGDPARYRVGENRLIRLALDGSDITGPLAKHYVLTKQTEGITEKYWKLVELRGQPVARLEQEPHLILKAQEGRVTGFSGCNSFTGTYALNAENFRISFGPLAMTRKFCPAAMDVERAFGEVLEQADNYSLNGDNLTLNRARMAPLARFEAVYLR